MSRVQVGYRSKLEWLSVDAVEIEPTAQRPYRESHAKKLAAHFNPKKLGRPIVAVIPNGHSERHIVVDGQHRMGALRILFGGDCQVECEVIRGLTVEEAAGMFRGRNTILRPRPIDDFLAGITERDSEIVAITNVVRSHGLTVGPCTATGMLSAVVALRRIYRDEMALGEKAPNLLSRTLALSTAAWGRDPEALGGEVLRGIALFLSRYGGAIEVDALEHKLRQFRGGALGLLGKARGIQPGLGGTLVVNIARVILTTYNTGRRKNLLAEWGAHYEDDKGTPEHATP